MPRKIVPLVTDELYHVFNRGADKRDVFMDRYDYVRFYNCLYHFNCITPTINLRLAQSESHMRQQPLVSVQAYNLLPNHFHILLTQIADGGISEFIKRVASGYTLYFNERYKRSGVLFQGTFKRVHVESSAQVQYLLAYINENRFVHGLPDDAEKITSSSEHYQGKRKDKLITELLLDSAYSIQQARLLAKDIYRRRKGERLATFD